MSCISRVNNICNYTRFYLLRLAMRLQSPHVVHACKIALYAFKLSSTIVTTCTFHLTESLTMTTATATLDPVLQANGRLTVEEFYKLAQSLAERRGAADYLSAELKSWRDSGFDTTKLKGGVQAHLESLLRSLAQWQIRFDGNYEHLQRTLKLIEDGSAKQHADDTIIARTLVDWCKNFPALAGEI
ncbi:hypothetical protein D3C85_1327690 [compost metagenome]